jgi:hypothetical protein
MEQEQEPEQERSRPEWPALVTKAAYLAYVGVVIWLTLPEHDRQAIRMRTAALVRQLAGSSARRAGVVSMGEELRTGHRLYGLPLLLSRLRDRAAAWYERARLS